MADGLEDRDALRGLFVNDTGEELVLELHDEPHPATRRLMDFLGVRVEVGAVMLPAAEATSTRDCAFPSCVDDAETGREYCSRHNESGNGLGHLTRAQKVALIRQSKVDHPTWSDRQRAASIGITYSAFRNLVNDPDGSKQRARRETYRGVCERCGGETRSDGTSRPSPFCSACAVVIHHEERRWTPEAIVETFKRFAEVNGRVPTATDVMFAAPTIRAKLSPERIRDAEEAIARVPLPTSETVRHELGSWEEAVRRAGLQPAPTGAAGHRNRSRRSWTREQIIEAIEKWAREHDGVPPTVNGWRIAGPDHPPYSSVARRIGWNEALMAAGFAPRTPGAQTSGGEPLGLQPPARDVVLASAADHEASPRPVLGEDTEPGSPPENAFSYLAAEFERAIQARAEANERVDQATAALKAHPLYSIAEPQPSAKSSPADWNRTTRNGYRPAELRRCSVCDVQADDSTAGCPACNDRHRSRERKAGL